MKLFGRVKNTKELIEKWKRTEELQSLLSLVIKGIPFIKVEQSFRDLNDLIDSVSKNNKFHLHLTRNHCPFFLDEDLDTVTHVLNTFRLYQF